ncbi:nucleotidyltransferase [Robertmurraya andreesenii]|uniref:tRNA(Met) cytidine acetate ligase n=1 Tax=Anoxybacillus andreesenii TaxID=1325932 RepID=A0ABT9V4L8_9BACL|nr:nucleotidyltransferase [Robertmurraya andreesenii]MDQ0155898.1 putative nucleotidyltransferase [Robertmurraya andreesenii]
MQATGIVVEYNPFHNGHAFHLEKTKAITKAEIVIAVMSGQFLQRGEPALLPKWMRAKMALLAGVDIVVELPYQFATQKADTFAFGAVSLLGAMGCESICFGSESGEIEPFLTTLQFLEENKEEYDNQIRDYLDQGFNYPSALSHAFLSLHPNDAVVDLSKPNNILGFQYVKAVKELKLSMTAHTVARTSTDYHDQDFSSDTIASATSIRRALFSEDGTLEKVLPYIPETTALVLQDYLEHYQHFQQWENYWPFLKYRLIQATAGELSNIYEVEEGLENRVMRAALEASSFQEFMTKIKTKRYTWTRLQRMCVHILTNTTKKEMEARMDKASYIRLLGMNEKGRTYLNNWKKNASLPLVSKLSALDFDDVALDVRASRIYSLGATEQMAQNLLELEYKQPPIYIKEQKEIEALK